MQIYGTNVQVSVKRNRSVERYLSAAIFCNILLLKVQVLKAQVSKAQAKLLALQIIYRTNRQDYYCD